MGRVGKKHCITMLTAKTARGHGVIPFEFCQDIRRQKTTVPGLSCGVVRVILRLAVSVEHRLVTDRRTDGRTDTRRQLQGPTCAS